MLFPFALSFTVIMCLSSSSLILFTAWLVSLKNIISFSKHLEGWKTIGKLLSKEIFGAHCKWQVTEQLTLDLLYLKRPCPSAFPYTTQAAAAFSNAAASLLLWQAVLPLNNWFRHCLHPHPFLALFLRQCNT